MQARTYLALGDGIAAAAEIERARQLSIPASETSHLMAHALLLQDEPDRALAELETVSPAHAARSEEHTSELQSLMRISYSVFCLKKKKYNISTLHNTIHRSIL